MDDQGGSNYHYRYHGEDQGVETTGDGALSVSATAGKLTVNAAKLNSGKNRVQLYGAKGIDVTHGEIIDKEVTSSNRKGGGLFSRSHTRDYESWEAHQVKTSDITGDSVALVADRGDINAVGSNIVGEHGALLQTRQGDITLKAGENTYHSEERHSKRKVGLMGSPSSMQDAQAGRSPKNNGWHSARANATAPVTSTSMHKAPSWTSCVVNKNKK